MAPLDALLLALDKRPTATAAKWDGKQIALQGKILTRGALVDGEVVMTAESEKIVTKVSCGGPSLKSAQLYDHERLTRVGRVWGLIERDGGRWLSLTECQPTDD